MFRGFESSPTASQIARKQHTSKSRHTLKEFGISLKSFFTTTYRPIPSQGLSPHAFSPPSEPPAQLWQQQKGRCELPLNGSRSGSCSQRVSSFGVGTQLYGKDDCGPTLSSPPLCKLSRSLSVGAPIPSRHRSLAYANYFQTVGTSSPAKSSSSSSSDTRINQNDGDFCSEYDPNADGNTGTDIESCRYANKVERNGHSSLPVSQNDSSALPSPQEDPDSESSSDTLPVQQGHSSGAFAVLASSQSAAATALHKSRSCPRLNSSSDQVGERHHYLQRPVSPANSECSYGEYDYRNCHQYHPPHDRELDHARLYTEFDLFSNLSYGGNLDLLGHMHRLSLDSGNRGLGAREFGLMHPDSNVHGEPVVVVTDDCRCEDPVLYLHAHEYSRYSQQQQQQQESSLVFAGDPCWSPTENHPSTATAQETRSVGGGDGGTELWSPEFSNLYDPAAELIEMISAGDLGAFEPQVPPTNAGSQQTYTRSSLEKSTTCSNNGGGNRGRCQWQKRPRPRREFKFDELVLVYETWAAEDYDRRGSANVQLTPELAASIKHELNEYKLNEMAVHEESHVYTHIIY